MIMRTFFDVFEFASVWTGPAQEDEGNDGFLLIGSRRPQTGIEEKIRRGYQCTSVVADLLEWGDLCGKPENLLKLRIAEKDQLQDFVAEAKIITDEHPYTEFYLWRDLLDDPKQHEGITGSGLRQQLVKRR
jgi:hypothetical protein